MKTLKLLIILLFLSGATFQTYSQSYTDAERDKLLEKMERAIDLTRDRMSDMQDHGKLQETQYFEEEEVIREAEQLMELLREGNYVAEDKINETIDKLDKLGVKPDREREGVQYSDENQQSGIKRIMDPKMRASYEKSDKVVLRGDSLVFQSKARIKTAKERLKTKHQSGDITKAEYQQQMQKIEQAEQKISELEQDLENYRRRMNKMAEENN